ncbi:hypothetical protein [Yinghuangia seranimata]|uniref:hypothetical protein n=1 Tax=Yinghuangia seranimata TaxID=408067 RepID=UPI00248BABE2|nr:hypothetical protein [Yinghuangia seranimata]MDI2127773.1 hypothetical protein [Yinghuangia seranimata]
MSTTSASFGPLTRLDDSWALGDTTRPHTDRLEFRGDGLHQHTPSGAVDVTPWPRVMDITALTLGARNPRGAFSPLGLLGGLPGPWKGHGRGYLHLTLRHPYVGVVLPFQRHAYAYGSTEFVLVQALLVQTAGTGEAHRLGDPAWLDRAVALLRTRNARTHRAIREAAADAQGV